MPALATSLPELLHRVFGHREFRAHQQPVCEAAAAGRDVLLVMPTGAGKSLCYQLPALARGGTALVISPLIALMDDQAAKLTALNLRVARIHSGLSRDHARQACRDYLDGNLDFLFIAPERLRVPGFPEMLARRKPALVAIDEAHCISAWGHDFRPDYRTLGQYLPLLRPAPVVALTATATPTVQQDIVRALDLRDPAIFITGFRRDNLHIEVTELSKPQRTPFIARLLKEKAARPAIVYASSRKSAEELASALGSSFSAAAYHAGLDPGTRERIQRSFLSGQLDTVVATIAFGMGVDKADVRTVIHAALPGSVEAYYQEIGRAGRDGLPSRAILLHGFADRRMHEFFLERDYPDLGEVERVAEALEAEPIPIESLQAKLKLDREKVERAIDKLLAQGAAAAEIDGSVRRTGLTAWQGGYSAQLRHRREQIDRIVAFAEGTGCRMAALIRHFGDRADGGRACGHCDSCTPGNSTSAPAQQASGRQRDDLLAVLSALANGSRSTGKLFTDLNLTRDRGEFDRLLDGLARAGLIQLLSDSFRSEDGRDITYRKASLTPEGRTPDDAALSTIWLRGAAAPEGRKSRSKASTAPRGSAPRATATEEELTPEGEALLGRLKQWRLERARQTGAPAFTVFHDSVLRALAQAMPGTIPELGRVRGLGPEKIDRYGADLVALCRGGEVPSGPATSTTTAPGQGESHSKSAGSAPRPAAQAASQRPTPVSPQTISALRPAPSPARPVPVAQPAAWTAEQERIEVRLREWRREQAAKSGLPTFFVLSDTVLRKVVASRPQTVEELRGIPDLGPDKLARYGAEVVALCRAV